MLTARGGKFQGPIGQECPPNRETGGSLPAAAAERGQVSSPFEIAAAASPPVLNKSGGSGLEVMNPITKTCLLRGCRWDRRGVCRRCGAIRGGGA